MLRWCLAPDGEGCTQEMNRGCEQKIAQANYSKAWSSQRSASVFIQFPEQQIQQWLNTIPVEVTPLASGWRSSQVGEDGGL